MLNIEALIAKIGFHAAKNEPQEETSTPLFLPSRTEQNSKLTWWVTYLRPSMPEHTAYPQIQMQ